MTPVTIRPYLSAGTIFRDIQVLDEVTSTNDRAMALGRAGHAEGSAIFAETQTAGRGRLGRSWQSVAGQSLTFSILLRPTWSEISRISLAAAVAVARALESQIEEPIGIKWPNDLQIAGRKIGGILCEAGSGFLVIGIGLNIFQRSTDFPLELADRATSLAQHRQKPIERSELAASLLNYLEAIYRSLPGAFPEIMAECESRSVLLNEPIEVELGDRTIAGVVTGLHPSGALRLQTDADEILISAGEVTLLFREKSWPLVS